MKDVFAGSVDIPQIKSADFNFFKTTHPIVSILVGVYVDALLDTGSMRSFVSDKVHAIFDFNNLLSSYVGHARFVSITGDPLDIKCSVGCSVKFPNSKYLYHGNFLVSSNIRYDCVLGWDFLAANRLELIVKNVAGQQTYLVQSGPPQDLPHSAPVHLNRYTFVRCGGGKFSTNR